MPLSWKATPADDSLAALTMPAVGAVLRPDAAKELAWQIAWRGVGQVSPNPLVGSVLVDKDHRFVAAGNHERVGQAHAEINAFAAANAVCQSGGAAKDALVGGTLYVTLEPCAHTGRTPPCAPRVIASQVARVVMGAKDPNPRVNGKSIEALRAAGIECEVDEAWGESCVAQAAAFHWQAKHGSPFVALKAAVSLDGVLALPGDERSWITGSRARSYGHFLRLVYDAVMIGQGTLVADNPTLDVRGVRESTIPGGARSPWRIVIDPDAAGIARFLAAGTKPALLTHAPDRVLWVVAAEAARHAAVSKGLAALAAWGAKPQALAADDRGGIAPRDLIDAAAGLGIQSLLLEGGAGLYGPFLAARQVNRLHLFTAPLLLGAAGAKRWTDEAGRLDGDRAPAAHVTPLGDDWVTEVELARA